MKKNILYIGAILFAGILASCSDFLDQQPQDNESVNSFYQNETDIAQAVNAAYQALTSNNQYGGNFIYFMEIRSDNTYTESVTNSGGIYGDIDLFRESPYNTLLNGAWVGCYDGIKRCNVVLDRIDNITMDKTLQDKYKGEMLFIRALTYFNLVRLWGDVPLVTNYCEDPFTMFSVGRTSKDVVYEKIKEDLTDAAKLLPLKADKNRMGAALKGSAQALLGKVYLTLGEYDRAVIVLKEVMESKNYEFMSNYAKIFDVANKNNAESIFEVQYTDAITGMGSAFANLFAPKSTTELTGGVGTTQGLNIPSDELYASYEKGDLRRDISIGKLTDGRLYCKKFVKKPVLDGQSDANFIVMRYTDVLMMYAEALNEVKYDGNGEAVTILNNIRKRAGLPELTSSQLNSQAAIRDAIGKERRYEFAFENQRWFDLLRTGKAIEVINNSGEDYHIDSHNLLYPMPQTQIDIVPGILKQNDGY